MTSSANTNVNAAGSSSSNSTYGSIHDRHHHHQQQPLLHPSQQPHREHISFSENDDIRDDESVEHYKQRQRGHVMRHLTKHRWVWAAAAVVGVAILVASRAFQIAQKFHGNNNNNSKSSTTPSKSETAAAAAAAETPLYYNEQLVDHFAHDDKKSYFDMKYYEDLTYFGGPGYPFFVQLGGEDPKDSLGKPFIYNALAKRHQAYNLGIEHRFFGDSFPVPYNDKQMNNADLHNLLSVEQALHDFVRLIQHKQSRLGCGPRGSDTYCPVMVVGGSYPGFLAVLMRLHFDHLVDMAYASSAPIYLYSHNEVGVDPDAYFNKITRVADQVSPGCAQALRSTWLQVQDDLLHNHNHQDLATLVSSAELGICPESIPEYLIKSSSSTSSSGVNSTTSSRHYEFVQELLMLTAMHFADSNMDFYPPTPNNVRRLELFQSCRVFQRTDVDWTPFQRMSHFLRLRHDRDMDNINNEGEQLLDVDDKHSKKWCYDMQSEMPPGPNSTIACSDWSGCGERDPAAYMWDYLACTLAPVCSVSGASMIPQRQWTLQWLQQHCQDRFEYTPDIHALHNKYPFTNFWNNGTTRLLFTSGLNDGWSMASVLALPDDYSPPKSPFSTSPLSGITVMNFPNGAHHSELRMDPDYDKHDTLDIKEGHERILDLVGVWLEEIRAENQNMDIVQTSKKTKHKKTRNAS